MSWLNNIKIIYKIAIVIVLLASVAIGAVTFAAMRMSSIDAAYSATIENVDMAAIMSSRGGRRAAAYIGNAYKLLSESTPEGNKKTFVAVEENRDGYRSIMTGVLKRLPEKASSIEPVIAQFNKVFTACQSSIEAGAAANTVEENSKAAARIRAECESQIDAALAAQTKLVDDLIAYAKQSAQDLNQSTNSTIYTTIAVLAAGLLSSLIIAMIIAIKGMSQPIAKLKAVMEFFAKNELNHDVPGIKRRDELGEMARTVEVFKTNGLEVNRMREEQKELETFTAAQRKRDMIKLADDFEGAVGEIINTVSSASTELEASATSLTTVADRSQQIAVVVAAASEEASTNVQSVASATEEMASTVNEISRQVQESSRIAGNAVEQAQATNARVGELSEAASRIGAVVELITTIAAQTNLLALNATIEAARAGDAGRGFAVVASEVKALAEQTTKATTEIGQQVTSIQAATEQSVIDIREIGSTIGKMSEIASTIAAAVEEQGAATQEIARNVQQAAQGTMQVSSNIVDVQRGTSETGSASSQVLSAAQSLSQDSNRLKLEVGRFLTTVRAA